VNEARLRRTEDMRILTHQALATGQLIRLALRGGLIEDFDVAGRLYRFLLSGAVIELEENDARIFLWGLIRGRERTLAQGGR
jgi:hypothetical protein